MIDIVKDNLVFENVSKPWLMVLLFQITYKNNIPTHPEGLGCPLGSREQMVYCAAYIKCINVMGIREMTDLSLPGCVAHVEK